ncbi:FAD-binding protein [Kriegella aquimaris]|uniref:FAD binding domain-containing protein n=1 Tax=Kriegella aquimaris TaxID=192904 RepID=A0A1G9RE59_9FLAO|nr:FAD-binding protein [Kriegella aquimaris]SDM21340.1 FAD binding domain-containing protein [Kriegella aquimaris]
MARTTIEKRQRWNTLHKNGPFALKLFITTKLEKNSSGLTDFEKYNDAAKEIQKLIKQAADNNEQFRAIGSKWSMSNIAHCKDRMHYNSFMNLKFPIFEGEIHKDSTYEHSNLHWFQCGNKIKEISGYLERRGKSLKTTGASNGQTIAGCISTGVHGSTIDVGSVQDYVVGLNLITGPKPEDNIYLERKSKPALRDTYAANFNAAKIIRDDEIFNAALVGLGSMGFVHGVVIEAEDLYLLHRYVRKIDRAEALKLADTLDFSNYDPKIPNTDFKGVRPFHYKIFMNPYNTDEKKYAVEFIYKIKYYENYMVDFGNPIPFQKEFVYLDLIYLFIKIAGKIPKSIPKLINLLKSSILPKEEKTTVGKLSEIFWDAGYQGKAFACSFGVDHTHSSKAMELLAKLTREHPVPGIFAMRFIKQSKGTLAFSKFPFTCMVEIDGIQWRDKDKIIPLMDYSTKMIEVLKNNNIPFTLHWGKNADWAFPNLVNEMYGKSSENWKKCRSWLLSKEMAKVFSNDFLSTTGLNEYIEVPPNFIESLSKNGQPLKT